MTGVPMNDVEPTVAPGERGTGMEAAWARVEAALPAGDGVWFDLSCYSAKNHRAVAYLVCGTVASNVGHRTPTDALNALADALEALRATPSGDSRDIQS